MGVYTLLLLFALEPVPASADAPAPPAADAASQPSALPASEPAAWGPTPIRFGLWLAPVVALGYRQEKIAGAGQLFLEYWFNDYVGLRGAVGLGAASTAFLTADAGAVFDLVASGTVIPYAEATLGMFAWLNNAVYPESGDGRAVTSFAPTLGVGARLFKTGTNYALGAHYRLLVDGLNAQNPGRIHGLLEIRLSLSFR